MKDFIKKEKKVKSSLDLEDDIDKVSSKIHMRGKKHISHQ
jgi:hypothetical protein